MDNKNSIEQLYAYVKDCYDGEIRCRVFEDRVVVATTIFLEGYDESVCTALRSRSFLSMIIVCKSGSSKPVWYL